MFSKAYFKKKFSRFGQMFYLTLSNFTKNALWESASSCAFGFIFSFIPFSLIIYAVLIGILRVYPNIYNFIITFTQEIEAFVNIQPFLDKMINTKSLNGFNIFLAFWVVWMARKLFNSIISSMNKIFRSASKRKSWFNQLLIFISEFAMTLVIIAIVIMAFVFSRILALPFFQTFFSKFPFLFSPGSHGLATLMIYFILFIAGTIAYRVIPGTKPMRRRCLFYSALNAISFFIVSFFLNKFMNVTNYNTVYGTISSIVLLMMKVYLFFILFLFYAQMLYVSQFFETLLRSEIYLLPNFQSAGGIKDYLRRFLFINPSQIQTPQNTVFVNRGQVLYEKEEKAKTVYFIKSGFIVEENSDGSQEISKGSFLGDVQCILNEAYGSKATASTDCELIRFNDEEFKKIIEKNHHAAKKAIGKILIYKDKSI